MSIRCAVTDLLADQCAHCRAVAARQAREASPFDEPASPVGPVVPAAYEGRCAGCEEEIEPGEPIVATLHGWQHEGCATG